MHARAVCGVRDEELVRARVDGVCLPDMVVDTGDGLQRIDDTTNVAYAMCATRFKEKVSTEAPILPCAWRGGPADTPYEPATN